MDGNEQPLGLRDRKRIETRARLEGAAVTLVLRDGLEQTTVDAISELADVSPRTFFNYFDSKDACILGLHEVDISEETAAAAIEQFDGLDLLESTVRLLLLTLDARPMEAARKDRMEILRRFPQLIGDLVVYMTKMASELSGSVRELMDRDPKFDSLSVEERSTHAELLLSICGGAVRVAMREWVDGGSSDDTVELEKRAVSLIREVIQKIS